MLGNQLGGKSFTTIYKREQDKLANQFPAGEDLVAGLPVALASDGTIMALTEDTEARYIGINMYNIKKGEITTVAILRSHVMVYAEAGEKIVCGDGVTLKKELGDTELNSDTSIEHYPHLKVEKAATGKAAWGIALDDAETGQLEVRVLIFDTI